MAQPSIRPLQERAARAGETTPASPHLSQITKLASDLTAGLATTTVDLAAFRAAADPANLGCKQGLQP